MYYYIVHCFVRPNEFGRMLRTLSIILCQTMPFINLTLLFNMSHFVLSKSNFRKRYRMRWFSVSRAESFL